ncbi:MAG: SRPBCC domain-containing protein [Salinivirgaceae bacterium]|nr:SRPBCC domain-containing protein [Salinivirgaceae bacterium]
MAKEKYVQEYSFNSSQKVLFNRLSTAGGLNEWFADNVRVQGKIYTFEWDGSEQKAEMVNKKDMKYVRFHWLDEEDEKTYFEFKLNVDELTGDLAIIVTDFAEPDEIKDARELWDSQISELRQILGS